MKIRVLEIQGFKSFADRTRLEFGDGISAIVGPNGCGKSNIVDAIKWVLGDMSPRSLRGKRMEDVIFAGSRFRKPAALAEVTLILDNADGLLKSERTEVSITRRLHRSGESEYLLSGVPARLKDIRELFYDTGLGAEGNAIMEQGQIDALLAANPQDRRGIFEEAAGISRYKQRRKEADQRLVRTRENLDRLLDVLELEEKRLRSLKTQAARARRYQELREELSRKRILRAVLRYRAIGRERDTLSAAMAEALRLEQAAAEDLAGLETRIQEREAARQAAERDLHAVETTIARLASDARASRDRAEYASRTRREIEERIAQAEAQAAEAAERRTRVANEIDALGRETEEALREASAHRERLRAAEAELAALDQDAARIRDAHDGAKREALAALGRISGVRNEEAERRAETRQLEERRERVLQQQADLERRLAGIDGEARELEALAARLEVEGRERAEALARAEDERARHLAAVEDLGARRAEALQERAGAASRLDVLARLAAARDGIDEGARAVLKAVEGLTPEADGSRDGVLGVLADLVQAGPGGSAVLDRLLGPAAGAVVVRSADDALRWIAWLRAHHEHVKGRFLPLDLVPAEALPLPAGAGELVAEPRVLQLVASVVSGTLLVERLEDGVAAWRAGRVNAVTPRGDRVTASGALLGGADAEVLGLLERSAEMRGLRERITALDTDLEALRGETRRAEEELALSEEGIRRLRAEIERHGADRSRRGEAFLRVDRERGQVRQGLHSLALEAGEIDTALAEARGAAVALAERLAVLERERETLEEQAEESARGYVAVEESRKAASERRMEVRLAVANAEGRAEGARRRVERATEELRALEERGAALAREAEDLARRRDQTEVEITESEALARQREDERQRMGETLLEARARLEALAADGGGEAARRDDLRRLHEEQRRRLEEFRLKDGELRVRVESLVEQVQQDHGLDLVHEAQAAEADESVDFQAIETEVESLRTRMEGLGNVNMNAIGELEEVETHVTFLRTQEKDLLDAKADLERAITQLDEVSTARFAETFEKVREHFRETFRRLFGGGRAEIVLEDASNLLESGVDIIARPPGKEQRTISLLSGGERTLTATALLFAVFQAKPSPFAILDEVDAALDEANVRRLIALVREFTDRSQFLVVTHAKTTMETADVLYGVTMEEPGVSKKVAVRLTEYAAETVAAG